MLIVNNELNLEEFKRIVKILDWRKVPRGTSSSSELFYSGKLETEEKIIHIKIRPSKRMAVSESFKNRQIDGQVPENDYRGKFYDFGTTIELLVDDKFINEISEIAKDKDANSINKKLNW